MMKVIIGTAVGIGVVVAAGCGVAACGACPTKRDIAAKLAAARGMKSVRSRVQRSTELGDDDEQEDEAEDEEEDAVSSI